MGLKPGDEFEIKAGLQTHSLIQIEIIKWKPEEEASEVDEVNSEKSVALNS